MHVVIYDTHPTPNGVQGEVREFYTPRRVALPDTCPSCHADLRDPQAANLASTSRADAAVACGHLTLDGFGIVSVEHLTDADTKFTRPSYFACARCDETLCAGEILPLPEPLVALSTLLHVREVIWPNGALDAPWTAQTVEAIAEILVRVGLDPLRITTATDGVPSTTA